MKVYYFVLLLIVFSCNSIKETQEDKTVAGEILILPHAIEYYRQTGDTMNMVINKEKLKLYVPLDVSCSSCLAKFDNVRRLNETLKPYEDILQIVPVAYSKDNSFDTFKYYTENDELPKTDLVMMLDLKNDFYRANQSLKLEQCVLTDKDNHIVMVGKFMDEIERLDVLVKKIKEFEN